ncbi:hypothetical protein SY83_03095 [Paenibacillus swuensis]|uniref:EF-hand domain-containing protein n=1 Tax=Paenibacillus swuensis TaxID=1178515 RepID=A0A172TEI2_9BACL|nr:HupE/UreJ family protein [Paenibacillus swuensis]ANE45475.1 hypothetical protein SY83_03095 [Paenibacillus swuensis]
MKRLRRLSRWFRSFRPLTLCMSFIFLFSLPSAVMAHPLSTSFTEINVDEKHVDVSFALDELSVLEQLQIDANQDGRLDPMETEAQAANIAGMIEQFVTIQLDGMSQRGEWQSVEYRQSQDKWVVETTVRYALPAKSEQLTLQDRFYENSQESVAYTNFVSIAKEGQTTETILKGDDRSWSLPLQQAEAMNNSSWWSFFKLGMEHILTGYDHLLFLFALLLARQSLKEHIQVVTAFTIAHSITITLGVMGIVSLPGRFVESFIAFSICYVAAENIFRRKIQLRWSLTFLFGLIHGLGFAGILTEMNIPKSHLAVSMLSFNLGIEVIQIALILCVVPVLRWVQQKQLYPVAANIASSLIIAMGGLWLFERIFSS